jgi:hypothetical protein
MSYNPHEDVCEWFNFVEKGNGSSVWNKMNT